MSYQTIIPPLGDPHNFTSPTTHYWQEILPSYPQPHSYHLYPPYQFSYAALLPDSRYLLLPIRSLQNEAQEGVCSLLVNQASMSVVAELSAFLAKMVEPFAPEVIIGLPTLGLTLAAFVAQALGLKRYVPLGYSRKFWYLDDLSTDVSSITSPSPNLKKLYLDPNQVPLIKGKKVVIIDDAVSSGTTLRAAWDLVERVGCEVMGCGVAMRQGEKWRGILGEERGRKVVGVFDSPLVRRVEGGWVPRES